MIKGTKLVKVDKKNTSKICNVCGYKNDNLSIKQRIWECISCNTLHDRDVNAAINILNKGLGVRI